MVSHFEIKVMWRLWKFVFGVIWSFVTFTWRGTPFCFNCHMGHRVLMKLIGCRSEDFRIYERVQRNDRGHCKKCGGVSNGLHNFGSLGKLLRSWSLLK